jgi:hypothetical protein
MKRTIICAGLILTFSIVAFGQKDKRVALDSGTRIDGQLQSTVDVKKARVGDEVVLKTSKAVKQNGQTVVPRGSKLVGRVTEIQQRTRSNGASRLGMVFDRIEGKNLSAPISASIVSITNAGANAGVGDMADADVFGSSSTSTRTSSGSSGGGLLGGVTNTVGSTVGGVTNTAGGVLNTTTQTAGNTTGSLGRTVNGLRISNAVNGSASSGTTLSAANKDIRLEKGATIALQLNSSVGAQ